MSEDHLKDVKHCSFRLLHSANNSVNINKQLSGHWSPANARRTSNVVLMLACRRRRRTNIKITSDERLVFVGNMISCSERRHDNDRCKMPRSTQKYVHICEAPLSLIVHNVDSIFGRLFQLHVCHSSWARNSLANPNIFQSDSWIANQCELNWARNSVSCCVCQYLYCICDWLPAGPAGRLTDCCDWLFDWLIAYLPD